MPTDHTPTSRRTLKEYLQRHPNLICATMDRIVNPSFGFYGRCTAVQLLEDGERFLWNMPGNRQLRASLPKAGDIRFFADSFGPTNDRGYFYYYRPDNESPADPLPPTFTIQRGNLAPENLQSLPPDIPTGPVPVPEVREP